jgi:hypothetical protein
MVVGNRERMSSDPIHEHRRLPQDRTTWNGETLRLRPDVVKGAFF